MQLLNMHGLNIFSYPCSEYEKKEDTLSAKTYQADSGPETRPVPKCTEMPRFFNPDESEVPETNLYSVKVLLK